MVVHDDVVPQAAPGVAVGPSVAVSANVASAVSSSAALSMLKRRLGGGHRSSAGGKRHKVGRVPQCSRHDKAEPAEP